MYCDYFGLRFRPFEDRADTRLFFATSDYEEALAALEYECHFGKGMALLMGDAGTGKTLLVRMLLQRLRAADRVVVLTWPSADKTDLVREASKGFGVSLPSSPSNGRGIARLRRHLVRGLKGDANSILIVDQAENLTEDNLAQLATLSELQRNGEKLLRVILVAQPHFRTLLESPNAARTCQQLFGERVLPGLTLKETEAYIKHRLQVAGAGEATLFDRDAMELVFEASNGLPRLINHICNGAMLAAYGAREARISRAIIADVTSQSRPPQRTVEASDLGLSSAEQVAAGWSTPGAIVTPQSVRDPVPSESPVADPLIAPDDPRSLNTRLNNPVGPMPMPPEFSMREPAGRAEAVGAPLPSDSASSRGEWLLHRLEQALARAERMGTTTDASVAQHAAIEKHVTALSQNAERLMGSLGGQIKRAAECSEDTEIRLERIFRSSEARLASVEAQLARTIDVADEARGQVEQIDDACGKANGVRSELTTFVARLADQVDDIQGRVSELMTGLEASESARIKVEELLANVSVVSREAEVQVDSLHAVVSEARTDTTTAIDTEMKRVLDHVSSAVSDAKTAMDTERTRVLDHVSSVSSDARTAMDAEMKRVLDGVSSSVSEARTTMDTERKQVLDDVSSASSDARTAMDTERTRVLDHVSSATSDARTAMDTEMKRVLDSVSSTASDTSTEMKRVLDRVATAIADADNHAESVHREVNDAKNEATTFHEQYVEPALARIHEELGQQIEINEHKLSEFSDKTSSLVDESEARFRAMDEVISASQQRAQVTLSMHQEAAGEALGDLERKAEGQQLRIEELAARQEKLQTSSVELSGAVAEADDKAAGLKTRLQAVESSIDELADRASAVKVDFTNAVSVGQALVGDVQGACGRVEETQRSIASALLDIGSACERLNTLREQTVLGETLIHRLTGERDSGERVAAKLEGLVYDADQRTERTRQAISEAMECAQTIKSHNAAAETMLGKLVASTNAGESLREQVAESIVQAASHADSMEANLILLSDNQAAGENAAKNLAELVGSAGQVHDALQGLVAHADEKMGRFDSRQSAAQNLIGELAEATTEGFGVAERIDDVNILLQQARDVMSATDASCHRLSEMQTTSDSAVKNLTGLVGTASQVQDTLQGLVAHADEKMGRLGSHQSAAQSMLNELSAATTEAMGIAERADEASRVVQRASDLALRAESNTKELSASSERAQSLIETIKTVSVPIERINAELDGTLADAERRTGAVTEKCQEAARIADRLTSVTRVLTAAKKTEEGIQGTLSDARETLSKLTELTDSAAQQNATLMRQSSVAQGAVESYDRMKGEAEQAGRRLESQLSAMQRSLEVADPLLRNFVAQSDTVEEQLGDLKATAQGIENQVGEMIARPAEILSAAQRQAAQLEKVCAAVRKIFGGLSTATLEAREQTTESKKAAHDAAQRLAQLSSETEQAARTLNEWVAEAVAVQARLERTLQRAPSISDTHPADSIRRVSRIATRRPALAGSRIEGELKMLSKPAASEPKAGDVAPERSPRAQEIANLIEEAKQAPAASSS